MSGIFMMQGRNVYENYEIFLFCWFNKAYIIEFIYVFTQSLIETIQL